MKYYEHEICMYYMVCEHYISILTLYLHSVYYTHSNITFTEYIIILNGKSNKHVILDELIDSELY